MDKKHQLLVNVISERIRSFFDAKRQFRVYHGSTNSTRVQVFERNNMVDVSGLNRVLNIDRTAMTALVESNVPMDQLVAETIKMGLVPPVVMEFPGITVGGAIQGGAGESSSFKWGSFSRIVNWYEMVLADGTILICSPTEHPDLFYGSAGAYGSLGVVTLLEVQLIKAGTHVALEYIPVSGFEEAISFLRTSTATDADFVDGIMYARDRGVIIVGRMTDAPVGRVHRYGRAWDQWFYLGVEQAIRENTAATESVPLVEYLFRYDRGAFWTGSYAFKRFGVPFNRLTRLLFNPFFKTRRMYIALNASGLSQEYIVQDLAVPEACTVEFLDWVDKETETYPLWLCPLLPDRQSRLQHDYLDAEMIINIGVWGPGPSSHPEFMATNQKIERQIAELGGRKWLYAHAYYNEDDFWRIYNRAWYVALRHKYHAITLPSVYEKIRVTERERVVISGRRGVWRAIIGPKRPS